MPRDEQALSFRCGDETLHGVLSPADGGATRGVLIVVGGPQYRAGSHRQFVLLARALAAQGIPAMRFDYRGMGDGSGAVSSFEEVDDDLRAAIDAFTAAVPGLREVVLWGLCDAASAALFYAAQDARIAGLVLLNPWVRTAQGQARATLKHYYRDRLLQPAFWRKLVSGRFALGASLRSLLGQVKQARQAGADTDAAQRPVRQPLRPRMLAGLQAFRGPVLLIISGRDLTAQEFLDLEQAEQPWRQALSAPRVSRQRLDEADHTFSSQAWRDQVAAWTGDWVRAW